VVSELKERSWVGFGPICTTGLMQCVYLLFLVRRKPDTILDIIHYYQWSRDNLELAREGALDMGWEFRIPFKAALVPIKRVVVDAGCQGRIFALNIAYSLSSLLFTTCVGSAEYLGDLRRTSLPWLRCSRAQALQFFCPRRRAMPDTWLFKARNSRHDALSRKKNQRVLRASHGGLRYSEPIVFLSCQWIIPTTELRASSPGCWQGKPLVTRRISTQSQWPRTLLLRGAKVLKQMGDRRQDAWSNNLPAIWTHAPISGLRTLGLLCLSHIPENSNTEEKSSFCGNQLQAQNRLIASTSYPFMKSHWSARSSAKRPHPYPVNASPNYQFRSTAQSGRSGQYDRMSLIMRRSPQVNHEVLLRATFLG
jgi:hypothetical protein